MPKVARKTGSKAGRKRKRTDRIEGGKRGRPSVYNEKAHCELAYMVALSEGSQAELGRRIGVSDATIIDWRGKYPSFARAWNAGKTDMRDAAFKSLYKRVKGFRVKEYEEKTDKDGGVTKKVVNKVILPDTSAIAIALERLDREKGLDLTKVDQMLAFIEMVSPDFFKQLAPQGADIDS